MRGIVSSPLISIVIPVYCEAENIKAVYGRIITVMTSIQADYEVIFIDDGSTDDTWKMIKEIAEADSRVRGECFSRNFGKEYALFAGLRRAMGDLVITLDGDLQHPPEVIRLMYEMWKNHGSDIVDTVKKTRQKETWLSRMSANFFYRLFKFFSGIDIMNATDFKLLDRKVVDVLLQFSEVNRFYRGLANWVGFKHDRIEIEIKDRAGGKTKWSSSKLLLYGINNLFNYSTRPLYFLAVIGAVFIVAAVALLSISFIRIITNSTLEGFPTVIILLLLIGGLIISSICLVGIYLGKIFTEVKARPLFVVTDQINLEN